MKSIDLLVLEDNLDMAANLKDIAESLGLECITFDSGVKVLQYLEKSLPCLPIGYLIDMNLGSEAEAQLPLKIHDFLNQNKSDKLFKFYTGYPPEEREYTQGVNPENVIMKPGIQELVKFFNEIKDYREQQIKPALYS